jgi:hypothetical protein
MSEVSSCTYIAALKVTRLFVLGIIHVSSSWRGHGVNK